MLKLLFTNTLLLLSIICFGQQSTIAAKFPESISYKQGVLLDSIFRVDDISAITIKFENSKHKLNHTELTEFKKMLKQSSSAGGLQAKPGHVFLELTFKDGSQCMVYGTRGLVNFDTGLDRWNNHFKGSFALPQEIDLDYLDQI